MFYPCSVVKRPSPNHTHSWPFSVGPGSHGLSASAPIAKFQHPSHALLEQHGFKQIVYRKYYKRCLEERSQKGGWRHSFVVAAWCCSTGQAGRQGTGGRSARVLLVWRAGQGRA